MSFNVYWEITSYCPGVSTLWNVIWIGMWNGMMEWVYITIQQLINVQTYMVEQQIALTKLS